MKKIYLVYIFPVQFSAGIAGMVFFDDVYIRAIFAILATFPGAHFAGYGIGAWLDNQSKKGTHL